MRRHHWHLWALAMTGWLGLGLGLGSTALAASFAWLEGEAPTSATFEYKTGGWGNASYLSGESWLHLSIPAKDVEKAVPAGGAILRYEFQATEAGQHEIWNRAGFEYIRAHFEWRMDDGPWTLVDPQQVLSTDLMEIANWCEVAWVPLGKAQLTAGKHALELRFPLRYQDKEKKKPIRIIYASDALVVSNTPFRPNGKHRPSAAWRSDADRAAAEHVFVMPAGTEPGQRVQLPLTGRWQYARFDHLGRAGDQRTLPVPALPDAKELHWSSIAVPGGRNALRPDQNFCHRYICQTRVQIPQSLKGRRLLLDFTEANTFTTVFVNGRRVGFSDAVLAGFTVDITDAVRWGEANTVSIAIKDAYYAIEPNDGKDVHHWFNIPNGMMSSNQGVTHRFDYPVKGALENGITDEVRLIAAGRAAIEDAYFIPSVRKGVITAETTVRNPGKAPVSYQVSHEIQPAQGGGAKKVLDGGRLEIAPGAAGVLASVTPWADATLWWPDRPHLYVARTLLKQDGKIVDSIETRFGFREWSIEGKRFALNGIGWQFRADLNYYGCGAGQAEAALAHWQETGQNVFRLRYQRNWGGMPRRKVLDFFDEKGVPVRCNTGTFDGQHASYGLVVQEGTGRNRVKKPRPNLFDNWRKQVAARVKRERNHASVFVWELDNEIIYINTRNFGNLKPVEPEFTKTAQLIASLDRQGRGQMVAGGRALMDQTLPVNGCHYEASPDRDYPDMAYGLGEWAASSRSQPWPMALDRPIFLSEEAYLHGRKPSGFAGVGGEVCFAGRSETQEAGALLLRMYSEGYRWQELGGFHFWGSGYPDTIYTAWQPVCALVREWTRTLNVGEAAARTVMVRNDTRYADPITFAWRFDVAGKRVAGAAQSLTIAPGEGQTLKIALPAVSAPDRASAKLSLSCARGGKVVWQDEKPLTILADSSRRLTVGANDIVVIDPAGPVCERLRKQNVPFRQVGALDALPDDFRVLVVGPDAVTAPLSTDVRWSALARAGKRLLILDQTHPLHYQAIPADLEPTQHSGRIAFMQETSHPAFAGLTQDDFFCWAPDHLVYRNIYRKPTRGARSLIQADDELGYCALAECITGEGLMLLCQAKVGSQLKRSAVAGRLFDNLLRRALEYRRVQNSVAVVLPAGDPRRALLKESALVYTDAGDVARAIRDAKTGIVVADASPAALQTLAREAAAMDAFTARGGYLMLWGLTPEGLSDFNRVVGVDHLLRPFRREKVGLAHPRPALAAGISQSDVALSSGKRIASWQSIEWAAEDTFTQVVDLQDIVPFLKGPGIEQDFNGGSIANGFTDVEFWRYICYFSVDENGKGPVLTYELPRAEDVIGFSIIPNSHYKRVREIQLIANDAKAPQATISLATYERGENPRQDFAVDLKGVKTLKLAFTKWDEHEKDPIGIDNLWLRVRRPVDFAARVQPLVACGGLVFYPRGKGGILLNQFRIPERETVPVNAEKKQRVVATMLRNMNAVFEVTDELRPGDAMRCEPVSLEGICNLYLTAAKGWPDAAGDLSSLPLGDQKLAGVRYHIRDFKTSPLESALTLGGMRGSKAAREVTGIPVNRKADALFFLHSMFQKRKWTPRRPRRGQPPESPPTVFRYVVKYSDGESVNVDVPYGVAATHWLQDAPQGLRGAALAWTAPAANGKHAAIHQLQWTNPRPEVPIATIDLTYGKQGNRWGVPIVLAISTADRQ